MYKDYFRLTEMPFSIAPDPRFLFMSDRHREAIAHMLYGAQGEGGIMLLTGEVGTGKTTICRSLLDRLPENTDVAFILNPRMNVEELLQTVCEEFHIAAPPGSGGGTKAYVDAIHARLLDANARGRRAILVIDEAQNLDPQVLEQLRLLTNLETDTRKLLQIFLIGQPELQDMLARREMRQCAQRIVARYHLTRLTRSETREYIGHRLRVSGASSDLFPDALTKRIYRATGGVPRLINLVCDRALLGAYAQARHQVTASILRQAVMEVIPARRPARVRRALLGGLAAAGALVAVAAAAIHVVLGVALHPAEEPAPGMPAASPPQALAVAPGKPPVQASPPADEPKPSVPAPLATADWPAEVARADSEAMAFKALFKIYGIEIDLKTGDEPCRRAKEKGMRCFEGRGGISDLLLLDRPVVLRLSSPDAGEYSVTLTALDMDSQMAELIVAGAKRRVAVNDLAGSWSGRYAAIWAAPPAFGDSVVMNQRGAAVRWLRQAMSTVDGVRDDGAAEFDARLAQRIRAFQFAEGIQPDGVVGPLTAIRLSARFDRNTPRLSTKGD